MSREKVTEVLVYAIVNKLKVSVQYIDSDGKTEVYEYVLPHLIGIHKKTENYLLSAYYIPRLDENKSDWKTFKLENILKVELTSEAFSPAKGYNPKDSRMKTVIVFVPYS